MSCPNCQQVPPGATVVISDPTQPFCDQCGNDRVCVEKIDTACVIYHLDGTEPSKLYNLALPNGSTAEDIFEKIDELIGGGFNVPLTVSNTLGINLLSTGTAGHTLRADLNVSPDAGNMFELRNNGIFVGQPDFSGKVKVNSSDVPDYLINQLLGGTDTIVSNSVVLDTGMLKIQPSLDIQHLLDKIRTDYLTQFCQIVSLCISGLPSVTVDCDNINITSAFSEGTASSGTVSIPVTVTGSGTVNVYASGAGFYGSQNVSINSSTTAINLTFNYDGSSPSGSRAISFIISGVQGGYTSCATTVNVGCDCDAVTNIQLSAIASDSADISWTGTSPAPVLGYTVNVKKSSDNSLAFTGTTLGTTITASGLSANTQYYVEVISECSETCTTTAGGVGTNFTTATENNYHLSAAYNASIDNVTGTGIPPLPSTGTNGILHGVQTGMTGTYGVTISGGFIPIPLKLVAYVNSLPVDCVALTVAGFYNLTITANPSDDVTISVDSGTCT